MQPTRSLADLKNSMETGIVCGFIGDSQSTDRLKELGIHLGVEVVLVGHAPFGGPSLFRFGNTVLALRKEEALCAQIQS